ncbi:MAG: gamma-glutamylcyclotransferase family protein [Actinomycetota bacterium]|nr:gamma-glutamylcyclotransferase family protein [Actinomycetota bacterium]
MTGASPTHLFVYGTLRPGEVRWQHLAPFVVGDGVHTTTSGDVYDTGLEYPAATFGGPRSIHGRVYELHPARIVDALSHLDEVEGAVRGLYHRVTVVTDSGHTAWAYQCGEEALLVRRIEGGDWLLR